METFLLSLHVVGAIIFVGPMTVAVSLFPRYARAAMAVGDRTADRSAAVTGLLHRISRAYAVLGLSVPVVGLALAARMGVLGDPWVVGSLALTLAAAALLATVVLPGQHRAMAVLDGPAPITPPGPVGRPPGCGAMAPGLFALTWVAVVVLMVARPGATTGL